MDNKSSSQSGVAFRSNEHLWTKHRLIYDANGNPIKDEIMAVSMLFQKQFQLSENRILGKRFQEIFHLTDDANGELLSQFGNLTHSGVEKAFPFTVLLNDVKLSVSGMILSDNELMCLYSIQPAFNDQYEENQMYESIVNSIALGVVVQRVDGSITFANSAAESILGLTIDQMKGRTSTDPRWKSYREDGSPFPGDDHPAMVSLRKGQRVENVIMGVFNPSTESQVWIKINAFPVFKQGEQMPYQVFTTFEDVTSNINTQHHLDQIQANLKAVFSNSMESVWSVNLNDEIVFLNQVFAQAFETAFGVKLQPGTNLIDAIPAEMRPEWKNRCIRVLGGESFVFSDELQFPGNTVHIEVSANPVVQENKVIGAFFLGRDVTERVVLQQQLLETANDLTAVVENTFESIWSVNRNYEIVFVNNVFIDLYYSLFGVYLKQGQNILETVPATIAEFWKTVYDSAFEGNKFELKPGFEHNGIKVHIHVSVNPVFNGNTVIGATVFGRDITRQKEDEVKLEDAKSNLSAILENTLDSIWSINQNYEISYINNVFAQSFNAVFGVLLQPGMSIYNALPDALKPLWKSRYDAVLRGERIVFTDAIEAFGSFIHVEVAANPIIQHARVIGASFFGRDITSQILTNEELKKTKSNLTAIVENSTESIWSIDTDYAITYLNEVFKADYANAFNVELSRGVNILHGLAPSLRKVWNERYDRVLKGERFIVQDSVTDINGNELFIEVSMNPIVVEGMVIGASMFGSDITERILSEAKIRESEANFSDVFNSIDDGLCYSTIEGQVIMVNDALVRLTGISRELLIGQDIISLQNKFVSKEEQPAMLRFLNDLLSGMQTGPVEFGYNNRILEVSASQNLITQRLIGVIRDVTEKKRVENEILDHERSYRDIFNSSVDALFIHEISSGKILDFNDKAVEMYGFDSREEFMDYAIVDFSATEEGFDAKKVAEVFKEVNEKETTSFEWRVRRKNGKLIWVMVTLTKIQVRGVTRALATIQNIDDIKAAESLKQKTEKSFAAINDSLVNLSADYQDNILNLTALCLRLLDADYAYFSKREGDRLHTFGEWKMTKDFIPIVDSLEDFLATYIMKQAKKKTLVMEDLSHCKFAEKQGNITQNGLKAFAGRAVFDGNAVVGALCIVFKDSRELDPHEQGVVSIIAAALGSEEQRLANKKALAESEKKYRELSTMLRLMADNMPDMLWAKNLNKEYLFANKAICNNLLNASDTNEPLGKTDVFFALRERAKHPDNPDWHTFGEICRDSDSITLNEMKPMRFDEFGNVKGKFLFLDVHKAPFYDDEGKLIGVIGSARDVTLAKEAENQLRKLSQAVEQSPASVMITNILGEIEYVNPKFTEVTGYSFEEVMGENPRMLKSGIQSDDVYVNLWNSISNGQEWSGEMFNKKKNGELFWESVLISPIRNDKGEIAHYLAIKEDITERKKTESKLIEAHKISGLGTYELDLKEMSFNVSDSLLEIYGTQGKPVFSLQDWLSILHPDDNETITLKLEVVYNTDVEFIDETFRVYRKSDGELRWIHTIGEVHRNESGEAVSIIGTSRDVTDLKNNELQLIKAKEKAEESDRLKTAFLQNLSHEIRSPLNAIIGFSDLLSDEQLSHEDRCKFTEVIAERGWQLTGIISDILTIASLETKQESLFRDLVNVNNMIDNQIAVFTAQAQKKAIKLQKSSELLPFQSYVYLDKTKVGQILNNLVANALKFTANGSIEIGCKLVENDLTFWVKDTGIGIDPEKHQLIFERFAQADDTIRRDYGGTGLGLSICKGFLELMNGRIWVESALQCGSVFYFTIPYINSESDNKPGTFKALHTQKGRKPLVLIAEDEYTNFTYLRLILEKMNMDVLHASNGRIAVSLCEQYDFDLVFMDIKMPEMDGIAATRLIRKTKPNLPIIAQTAHAAQTEVLKYSGEFDEYITKPFTREIIEVSLSKAFKSLN